MLTGIYEVAIGDGDVSLALKELKAAGAFGFVVTVVSVIWTCW